MSTLCTQRAGRAVLAFVAGVVVAGASFAGSSAQPSSEAAAQSPEIRFPLFVADPRPEPLGPDSAPSLPPPDRRMTEGSDFVAAAGDKDRANLDLRQ
ncbi:MAG: hypothetical protein EOO27_16760 [Comamonadaceae bacterium]|nr:MAG: hypothetical protein EOO27_16760 [Comamonadaceae bacterium]